MDVPLLLPEVTDTISGITTDGTVSGSGINPDLRNILVHSSADFWERKRWRGKFLKYGIQTWACR